MTNALSGINFSKFTLNLTYFNINVFMNDKERWIYASLIPLKLKLYTNISVAITHGDEDKKFFILHRDVKKHCQVEVTYEEAS
ncbi:CLUMA_CG020067, isoform A [Clunio marinus]|uniref:CLUMA_CG020067, isoform A n=1 Tax=Clunio marinus TaxID=568069 RepID=A0A1J1J7W4_9DIPT|nr:CLUMA_CG020067, isoform A [Clunio marinus]